MISSEFRKDDYWRVKWPMASVALSLVLCGSVFFGLTTLDAAAATELRRARAELDEARQAVDKIEEEEATIIAYIGNYRQMEQEGIVEPEDRLQFQEAIAELHSTFNLFPVSVNFGGQAPLPLQYPQGRTEPGRAIVLQTSLVELSLPLLHENDLANLLLTLVEGPGLLQPLSCLLEANNNRAQNYIYLARHFRAACSLNWYTFQLPPPAEAQ